MNLKHSQAIGSGRAPSHGAERRRRGRASLAVVLAAAIIALGACSSSHNSSTSNTTSGSPTTPSAGGDIGITSSTIHIAAIADVNTAQNPGLFQKSLNVVKAWAAIVNSHGGLAGRQVIVDTVDSKEDPNVALNAVIQACSQDFALVGTEALALSNFSNVDNCTNSQGQAIGIPNLAGISFGPLAQCDPVSYTVIGADGTYCNTAKDPQQTYTVNVGDLKWLQTQYPNLHGVWLYDNDLPTGRATQVPIYIAQTRFAGVKTDGQGYYGASALAPQSALIPDIQVMKQNNSTFASVGVTPPIMVLFRKEAAVQGVNSVKVWLCQAGCYNSYFIPTGGSSVENTFQTLQYLPFYTEYQQNSTLAAIINQLGGVQNFDSNAMSSLVEALLFQDAVQKVVSSGKPLNRQNLFDVLKNQETSFSADGIVGATNVSAHTTSPCYVEVQVQKGAWARVHPTQSGSFDCGSGNLVTMQLGKNF